MARLVATINIKVTVSWWFKVYLAGVVTMSHLTGLPPNMDKVQWYAKHGVRVRMVRS